MSDRELLEAAAKAAGIVGCWKEKADAGWGGKICGFFLPSGRQGGNGRRWDPLTDDGDALRLAVVLDLSSLMIFTYSSGKSQGKRREFWTPNSGYDGGKSATTEDEYAADPYAATRRAIVRAAAAMAASEQIVQPDLS